MDIILLERIEKLGAIGDVVSVKDGYARNFLLPNKKALRANDANRKVFEANRERIEADNADRRGEAEKAGEQRRRRRGRADPRLVELGPALRLGHRARHRRCARRPRATTSTSAGRAGTPDQDDRHVRRARRAAPRSRVTVKVNVARSDDEAELQARASTSWRRCSRKNAPRPRLHRSRRSQRRAGRNPGRPARRATPRPAEGLNSSLNGRKQGRGTAGSAPFCFAADAGYRLCDAIRRHDHRRARRTL